MILILITSQVHNQSVNVWSTVVIVSAQTLQTAVRKQTATAVIRETKLLIDLVFYIISLIPALSYSYMFSIVELCRIVFPCKEQQPVIRGTITESCSMQQLFKNHKFKV